MNSTVALPGAEAAAPPPDDDVEAEAEDVDEDKAELLELDETAVGGEVMVVEADAPMGANPTVRERGSTKRDVE